jgi:hypothetical protein
MTNTTYDYAPKVGGSNNAALSALNAVSGDYA